MDHDHVEGTMNEQKERTGAISSYLDGSSLIIKDLIANKQRVILNGQGKMVPFSLYSRIASHITCILSL